MGFDLIVILGVAKINKQCSEVRVRVRVGIYRVQNFETSLVMVDL